MRTHNPSSKQRRIRNPSITMPIVSNPSLIFYTCIAKGTTILAEFNGEQSRDLSSLAQKCIDLAPPHHSIYSHALRQRRYTFLIDDPFVYFAIFHETLAKSEGLQFLNGVKIGFCEMLKSGSVRNFNQLGLQSQFDFILHRLHPNSESVSPPPTVPSAISRNTSLDKGVFSTPLLKKKKRVNGETGDRDGGSLENKVDAVTDTNGFAVQKNSSLLFNDGQKAKQVWKKQVWVVLSLDLFVCLVLFGVWLRVCRGFRCIDS